jgi:hypothetical protein
MGCGVDKHRIEVGSYDVLTGRRSLAEAMVTCADSTLRGRRRRNFYLFQFKYSEAHQQFKGSFQRLIDYGMRRLFGAEDQDTKQNPLIQQIKATLLENQAIIERFYVHFVFLGNPESADQSKVSVRMGAARTGLHSDRSAQSRSVPGVGEF